MGEVAGVCDESRATIDFDVSATNLTGHARSLAPALVIETKTAGTPSLLDRALWGHGLRPLKLSKCCTGLASLNPDLRANKWHRTMVNHRWHDVSSRTSSLCA